MKAILSLAAAWLVLATTASAEQKIKVSDLPAAVQATVKAETANATVLGISKEAEKGKTVFEVETKVGSKTRDFVVDAAGKPSPPEAGPSLALRCPLRHAPHPEQRRHPARGHRGDP